MITGKLIFSTELFCNDLINVICSDTDNKILLYALPKADYN